MGDRDIHLEYATIASDDVNAPLLVFLHEGLGSLAMWKDWPQQVCAAANCRGLIFSRYGYGQSTPRPHDEQWSSRYLHQQAYEFLPAFFTTLGIDAEREKPILFGHSDGGTIALLYAARYPQAVRAISVAAPHIFVEDITLRNIEQARQTYLHTDLASKLGRYHNDPDSAFWGWNNAWLAPDFRHWNIESVLANLHCPIMAIQGLDDHYGSLEQIRGIKRHAPQTQLVELADCGHSPHIDQPELLIQLIADFVGDSGCQEKPPVNPYVSIGEEL